MRHKLKGIVIKETPKGETSKLLTVLTSSRGVLTVNAKGVRKLSSPYLKSAQLFAFSDMLLYEKNGFYTLSEAALITDFYSLREDIKKYALACYFCEAASAFAIPGDEGAPILRLLLNSLYALENSVCEIELLKAAFELRLCAESGFMPDVSYCADCGETLENKTSFFDINDGVVLCPECATVGNEGIVLTPSATKALNHIVESDMAHFVSFRIGKNDILLLSDCAERFLLSRAERGFKTLSFYKHCEELK